MHGHNVEYRKKQLLLNAKGSLYKQLLYRKYSSCTNTHTQKEGASGLKTQLGAAPVATLGVVTDLQKSAAKNEG